MPLGPPRASSWQGVLLLAGDQFTRGLLKRRVRRAPRRPSSLWFAAMISIAIVLGLGVGRLWTHRGGEVEEAPAASGSPMMELVAPKIRWAANGVRDDRFVAGSAPAVTDLQPTGTIEPGQTLFSALTERGAAPASAQRALVALSSKFDFRRSRVGHSWEASLQSDGTLVALKYQTSPERYLQATLGADATFSAVDVRVPVERRSQAVSIPIVGSLWESVEAAGLDAQLAQALATVFQWDIDFSQQAVVGDALRVVYERHFLDGKPYRLGDVLAAEYLGVKGTWVAFRSPEEDGTEYFNANGESLSKLFLAAPCRYRRISSRFDPDRLHPVLKIRRPHLGVDYAAPTGTPVRAVADGIVGFVGPKGGNGNLVSVKHGYGYESGYAHLSRFARGLKMGQRVEQGQVIGFVGNTGLSTGAHLHFGLKHDGKFVDPLERREIRRPALKGRQLAAYSRRVGALRDLLDKLPVTAPAASPIAPAAPAQPGAASWDEAGDF